MGVMMRNHNTFVNGIKPNVTAFLEYVASKQHIAMKQRFGVV
jgi:hypothetical protein